MRFPLRVLGPEGTHRDVVVTTAPDCTVGELSDALAPLVDRPAGGTIRSRWPLTGATGPPARSDLLRSQGPRSGSTVEVVPFDADDTTESLSSPSPVVLVGVDGTRHRLDYGVTDLHGAHLQLGSTAELTSSPGSSVRLNGLPIAGCARVRHGDLIGVGARSWMLHIDQALSPPRGAGTWSTHRPGLGPTAIPSSLAVPSPTAARHVVSAIALPAAPPTIRLPGLPVLSATVPLLMGAVLWLLTRSPTAAVFVLFSFVFVVAAGIEARREARVEDRFRRQEFLDDLEIAEALLEQDAEAQRELLASAAPTAVEAALWTNARSPSPRLWERSRDPRRPSPLVVRLGEGQVDRWTPIDSVGGGRRELADLVEALRVDAASIDAPATLDMGRTNGVALVGDPAATSATARAIVMQLCATVAPSALQLQTVLDPASVDEWRWTRWLPHLSADGVSIAAAAATGRASPVTLVVADRAAAEVEEELASASGRRIWVWMCNDEQDVPAGPRAVYLLDRSEVRLSEPRPADSAGSGAAEAIADDFSGSGTSGDEQPIRPDRSVAISHADTLSVDEAEPAARLLAGLWPTGADGSGAAVGLSDIVADPNVITDPEALEAAWASSEDRRLVAPIGVAVGDGPAGTTVSGDAAGANAGAGSGVVNLDLVSDGPHALIAGTTGAGKSELLRTLLCSLALHHPPERLSYLLVDYKGGAAFGPLAALPHSVGLVTDLSPSLARRVLVSLGAELRQREEWLAERGWDDLRCDEALRATDRPAALLIVVDEFAAMAREIPDFVDGLVDIAQRGRSLGIHLLLATQRPAGVVTDSIRANTSIRLALRVTDADDSIDVVDGPEAAAIPPSRPGAAMIRLGPGRSAALQVAHCAAPLRRAPRVQVRVVGAAAGTEGPPIDFVAAPTDEREPTQLSLAIETIRTTAANGSHPLPRRPWAEPLPDRLSASTAPTGAGGHRADQDWVKQQDWVDEQGSALAIGLVDRPDEQRHAPLVVDLADDRGVAVLGASGSGRSTTAAAIAAAIRRSGPGARVYAVSDDPGVTAMATAASGDAVRPDDVERAHRLIRTVAAEVTLRRRSDARAPRPVWLVLIDGVAAFEAATAPVDHGAGFDTLQQIARDGPSVGVHVVATAHRRAEIPHGLAASLGLTIQHRPSGDDDWDLNAPVDGAGEQLMPGRCVVRGEVGQVALPGPLDCLLDGPEVARSRIHRTPTVVELDDHQLGDGGAALRLGVGVEVDSLDVAYLDLTHHHGIVVGGSRSGRTTALRTLVRGAEASQFRSVHLGLDDIDVMTQTVRDHVADAHDGTPTLICLDDLPLALDSCDPAELDGAISAAVAAGRHLPLRVLLGGDAGGFLGCYADSVRRVRTGRTGIVLGPSHRDNADVLHVATPNRNDLPGAPGRGWVVVSGECAPVQLAVTPHP